MTPPPPDTPPHGLLIANLLAQIAFGLLAMTVCLPSMQEWGAIFGAGQAGVQLTLSGYLVAYGALQLLYGPLSDRHGRKRILMIGLAVAGIGSLLAALAPDLPSLIAARTLQGAGSAAGMVVGRAMVQDLFRGPERTRVMAWVGMTMGFCPPLATVIGGQLHVALGWQSNFLLVAVLAAVLLVAAWRGLPTREPAAALDTHWLHDMGMAYARLAREPAFLLHVAILAMTTAAFYVFLGGAPIVLGGYGVGPADIGWYIMCVPFAYVAGNFLTSRLIRRQGDRRMMALGQLLTLAGIALLLALAGVGSPLAFALPLMLLGIGHGFLMPPTLAGTVGAVPALAGAGAAVAGLMQQLMGALGGYSVGLVSHANTVNLGLLMLAFTLCAMAAQFLLRRRH
ncbi:MFS transporter [Sulfuritalea sp.]|uniref:MFS transporter n=1 Tax=Sulfuritalea sp. TaxID=2480090 RepID=UPI001AC8B138|nr:MFS transporter [Sulfuritalea sp.]MBN8474636.1 MFS transporter [Sulfuritalea sp.]